MRERVRMWMLLATMVVAATLVAADGVPPTETKGDAPAKASEKPAAVERIVAVGDVHGDFDQLVKVLRAAEIINDKNQWTGGKTHLVQTGDVFDRGPDSRKAMDLLMSLEAEAAKAGGAVHVLIGNHEAMVLADHWQYLTEEELKSFGGEEEFRKAVGPEGKYGKWIRSHDAVLKLNGILFLHAGLRGGYAKMSLEEINKAVREELTKNQMEDVTADPSGPLWDRRFSLDEGDEVQGQLAEALKQQGASHMVVGHTVMREGITPRLGGRVICIDVGMSKAYGGPASCLLIDKGVFYVIEAGKEKRKLDVPAAAAAPATVPGKDAPATPPATPATPSKESPANAALTAPPTKTDPKVKMHPAPEVEPTPQTPVPVPTR